MRITNVENVKIWYFRMILVLVFIHIIKGPGFNRYHKKSFTLSVSGNVFIKSLIMFCVDFRNVFLDHVKYIMVMVT